MPFSTSVIAAVVGKGWKNEFHGVCPQCKELFILPRPKLIGVTMNYIHIKCTECTAYFDGDLLKQIRAFLKEKPND